MNLPEVAQTSWYQDNLEILLRSGKFQDSRVKNIMALLGSSQFEKAASHAEAYLVAEEPGKDLLSAGSLHAWLVHAAAFSRTIQLATAPKEPK